MAINTSMSTRNTGCLSRAAAIAVLALASTSLTRPAMSQDFDFVAVAKVSGLSRTTGIRIQGAAPGGLFGADVAVGDVNGDGINDIVAGAPEVTSDGLIKAGAVDVILGKRQGHSVPFIVSNITAANGTVIKGPNAEDKLGDFVATGRFNGDPFHDILAGAPGKPFAATVPGNTFLVPGASNLPSPFTVGPTNSSKFIGVDLDDGTGSSGAPVGDLNRDGFPDFAIAASRGTAGGDAQAGQSFVIKGALIYPPNVALSTIGGGSGGFRADGIDAGDHSGFSVASAGDVNGDGFGDMIIGAYDGDPNGVSNAGESYVIFGNAAIFASNPDLAGLDGSNGFRFDGIDIDDLSGVSVASAGDVNGDGFGDLVVGAPNGDPNGDFNAGESYVVFGKASGFPPAIDLANLDGVTGFRIDGMDFSDFSGSAVAPAGDVNGDGFDDILIGAQFAYHDGAFSVGESYVVLGKATGFASAIQLSSLDGSDGFRIDGIGEGDQSGRDVASGDVNGDGFSDVVIGARFADPNAVIDAGEVYVVYGQGPNSARTRASWRRASISAVEPSPTRSEDWAAMTFLKAGAAATVSSAASAMTRPATPMRPRR